MEDVEMEFNAEPAGESHDPHDQSLSTLGSATFKTPMIFNRNKLHPYTMYESSGYVSASSPEMNSTSGSLPCSTRMTRRISNDSQLSLSPECSLRARMLQSVEASPDSGFDSESACGSLSSGKDSVLLDMDVSTPFVTGMKRPAPPDVINSVHSGKVDLNIGAPLWLSTPLLEDAQPRRITFADSCDFHQSPTKRRRPSAKKASRDLFQSRRRGSYTSFSEESPSTSKADVPSFAGRETVDFLFYLGKRSTHQPALDSILGYLSPADLCRTSLVSRSWKSIVESVPAALRRKRDYVESCIQIKENLTQSVKKAGVGLPFRGQLIEVQNYTCPDEMATPEPRSPPVSPSKVRFNLYLKEGRKLGPGQALVHCPQCMLPARKEAERAVRCTRSGCQFYFCALCLCKFHGETACPVSTVKHRKRQVAIGSRESRQNLRRLCK